MQNISKCGITEATVRNGVVRVVEYIEGLGAQAEGEALGDLERLKDLHIDVEVARAAELIAVLRRNPRVIRERTRGALNKTIGVQARCVDCRCSAAIRVRAGRVSQDWRVCIGNGSAPIIIGDVRISSELGE